MNVRKAQKHMQRARELLNPESQLGFGAGDDKRERAQKRKTKEESIIRTRSQRELGRVEVNKRDENNPFTHSTFECPLCLLKKNRSVCVMICPKGHAVCLGCAKKIQELRCPMCRSKNYLRDKFVGNCEIMYNWFTNLQHKDTQVTIRRHEVFDEWHLYINPQKDKAPALESNQKYLCEVFQTSYDPNCSKNEKVFVRDKSENEITFAKNLYFPPGYTDRAQESFAEEVRFREMRKLNTNMNLLLMPTSGGMSSDNSKVPCVLQCSEVDYSSNAGPSKIIQIVGRISFDLEE
jgi:hypothetical protein